MNYDDYYRLSVCALDCKDFETFLAEEGGSVDCDDADAIICDLHYIYTARTIADIRAAAGLSRAEFSRRYGIPLRTIEDWEAGRRVPPDYLVRLIAFAVFSDHPPAT